MVTNYLFFNTKSLISPFKHGFLKGRSTVTNLEFTTYVFRGFLGRARTDAIYTDFNKAFDRVDHEILFLKLSLIGIPDIILCWLGFYLPLRIGGYSLAMYYLTLYMLLLAFRRAVIWVLYWFYCFSTIFFALFLIIIF